MKAYNLGQYLITLETVPHSGAIIAAAIPDNGATIRRTFYGYTAAQARREFVALIKTGV